MGRPDFQHIEASERHLLDGHADAYASIELGAAPDGRWLVAVCVSGRDWGRYSGLGWWPDLPREDFSSRDEAFAAGVARVREHLGGRVEQPAGRRVTVWLDSLSAPQQTDLFAHA